MSRQKNKYLLFADTYGGIIMNIKEKVEELVKEIQKNPKLLSQFKANPVPVIE